jgi:tRNA nucleotidyltransferase/poly(A) polymerase
MNQHLNIINQPLVDLRQAFVKQGFDLRLVGGCVRDTLLGLIPKDVDLHTDANPDEQIAIYQSNGVRYIETGLQHGTVTVVLNNVSYEITSLRQDTETDGRHANVVYTRDSGHTLDDALLQKFEELGYDKDQEYDLEELTRVFRQINQLG